MTAEYLQAVQSLGLPDVPYTPELPAQSPCVPAPRVQSQLTPTGDE